MNGISSKGNNAGRKPKISSVKNKLMIKEIISKSPTTFGYLKNTWGIRLLASCLTAVLKMNVSSMQTWRTVNDLDIVSKKPKLSLEHESGYEEKKKTIDNYERIAAALLKKDSIRI